MPTGLPAPQFEMRMLEVKWMENGVVKQAWNMLQDVGSPEHTHFWPRIPEWNQRMGGFNFQIEATVLNKTSATLNLKFRTQTCSRGTYAVPPMRKPPCGDLVESGAAATVGPYGTVLLPVFQLRMWSKDIDQHCEIVDANDHTVYNCLVPYYDNPTYLTDDWYIPIDALGTVGIPSVSAFGTVGGPNKPEPTPIRPIRETRE
ncbi:MAG: hypothetical protein ABSA81_10460 [Candidatus Bathyarchaeia archaeon]